MWCLVTAGGLELRLKLAIRDKVTDLSDLNTLFRMSYGSPMSESTVEEEPEYNSDSEKQRGDVEFEEEAHEMTRAPEELREVPPEDVPPDMGEDPRYAVPPGYSEPEGGA
jgi:hypothetical protein